MPTTKSFVVLVLTVSVAPVFVAVMPDRDVLTFSSVVTPEYSLKVAAMSVPTVTAIITLVMPPGLLG